MDRLAVGVIGLGEWGESHVSALCGLANARVVAVCSRSEERAREVAARYGVPRWYPDPELLARDPVVEAATVATEERRHVEPALAVLRAHKPLYLEKPIAADLAGADAIIACAEQEDVPLMVGHLLRFDPGHVMLKAALERGELGEVVSIFARRDARRSLLGDARDDILPLAVSVHDIDLALWYVGSGVREVSSLKSLLLPLYWALLRFAGGAVGAIEGSYSLPDSWPQGVDSVFELVGTEGSARVESLRSGLTIWGRGSAHSPDTALRPSHAGSVGGLLRESMAHFVRCVAEGRPFAQGLPRDARAAVEVALAMSESAASGRPVTLG